MQQLADDFWTMRGNFRVAHVVNIGTHMSLVRAPGGGFVLLDCYKPDEAELGALMTLTNGGSRIETVLNLHPFHTVYCESLRVLLPQARFIGTRRHHQELPALRWDPALIEAQTTQQQFAAFLDFSIPHGVDFISRDEAVHVSSVIVRHRNSGIIHVDDTINVIDLPSLIEGLLPGPRLRFHPKLAEALETRAGAADDYTLWAKRLARDWSDTHIICAAHNGIHRLEGETFCEAIDQALDYAAKTLDKHRETYG